MEILLKKIYLKTQPAQFDVLLSQFYESAFRLDSKNATGLLSTIKHIFESSRLYGTPDNITIKNLLKYLKRISLQIEVPPVQELAELESPLANDYFRYRDIYANVVDSWNTFCAVHKLDDVDLSDNTDYSHLNKYVDRKQVIDQKYSEKISPLVEKENSINEKLFLLEKRREELKKELQIIKTEILSARGEMEAIKSSKEEERKQYNQSIDALLNNDSKIKELFYRNEMKESIVSGYNWINNLKKDECDDNNNINEKYLMCLLNYLKYEVPCIKFIDKRIEQNKLELEALENDFKIYTETNVTSLKRETAKKIAEKSKIFEEDKKTLSILMKHLNDSYDNLMNFGPNEHYLYSKISFFYSQLNITTPWQAADEELPEIIAPHVSSKVEAKPVAKKAVVEPKLTWANQKIE